MADARRVWWVVAGAAALPLHRVARSQWRSLGAAFEDAEDPYGERFVLRPGPTAASRSGRVRLAAIAARL